MKHRRFILPWVLAGVGLVIPGGLFTWWLLTDATTPAAALQDKFAIAFIADVLVTTAVIAVYFAHNPPGRYRWPWFVCLSLLSTLAFGLVLYWWLNARRARDPSEADRRPPGVPGIAP